MLHEDLSFTSHDGTTTVVGDLWLPEGADGVAVQPRGIVQIVHGMVEYIRCYEGVARRLTDAGYAVCGIDQLGHGRTTPDPEQRGVYEPTRGADHLVEDQHTLRTMMQERYVGLPYVILGHSMGSFVTRCYLGRHGAGLAGAVVMGTAWMPHALIMGTKAVTTTIAAAHGWDYRSPFVDKMGVGGYNKAFEGTGAKTGVEWLCRDEARPIAYVADPDCGWMFSVSGYYVLVSLLAEAESPAKIAGVPADLPILLMAGAADPVGNCGEGPTKAADAFRAAGVRDVTLKLYEGARHELHNETCADEVFADLIAFLDRVTGADVPAADAPAEPAAADAPTVTSDPVTA